MVKKSLENRYKELENLDIVTQREIARRARSIARYGKANQYSNLELLGITENDDVFEEIRKQNMPTVGGRMPFQQDAILKKVSEFYGFPLPSVEIEERLRAEIRNTEAGILHYLKSKNYRLTDEEQVEIYQKQLKL